MTKQRDDDKASLVLQLPEVIEQAALQLVQFNTEPEPVLAARLASALGAVMPLMLAGPWLRSVATWHVLDGDKGPMPGVWCVLPELVSRHSLPADLPENLPAPHHFDLLELFEDTSGRVSVEQAGLLQRAIRSLRDGQLASNLGALDNMSPTQLQELLTTQGVSIRDVVVKLVQHIDPIKAREHLGPGFFHLYLCVVAA